MERRYDLVIIGAGPAGMSAAIYESVPAYKWLCWRWEPPEVS